ncbi:MAG: flagellar brake protein [Pseudomonadota bacterium]
MKFEDMNLTYGCPLQLQSSNSAGQPERFSCRLIGCLPGRSILLSVPKVGGKLIRFRPGQKIVTRLMVDNGIGIFVSVVETQTSDPYPILHIAYPENVNFKGIRGATRVDIKQPAVIVNLTADSDEVRQGAVVNISISGARIEASGLIGEIGNAIRLGLKINVAGIVRDLSVEAIIRSRVEPESSNANPREVITYGIQFTETDEDRLLLLYAYVYSQIENEDITN